MIILVNFKTRVLFYVATLFFMKRYNRRSDALYISIIYTYADWMRDALLNSTVKVDSSHSFPVVICSSENISFRRLLGLT